MEIDQLKIDPIYRNKLDMWSFARMLESPTQCYKFYWLEAIITLINQKDELCFEEIIYEMFWEAWFTVTQYHLHLGPTILGKSENYIEHVVHIIEQDPDVKHPMTRELFLYLVEKNKTKIKADIDGLIKNVPYRLLSSFVPEIGGDDRIWDQKKRLIAYFEHLNETKILPYTIMDGRAALRKICISPAWKQVFLDNYAVIKSWIQMKKVRFLQDKNPGVPGVVYKLENEEDKHRKLEKVRQLWITFEVVNKEPLVDLYSGEIIEKQKLSIDHFIPWSYIVNDELWNLVPMDKSNNSSKGNRLPKWDIFFPDLARIQYKLYQNIYSNEVLRKQFEGCKAQNLNAIWASEMLFIPGKNQRDFTAILEQNMKPIYNAALLQGYPTWNRCYNFESR